LENASATENEAAQLREATATGNLEVLERSIALANDAQVFDGPDYQRAIVKRDELRAVGHRTNTNARPPLHALCVPTYLPPPVRPNTHRTRTR